MFRNTDKLRARRSAALAGAAWMALAQMPALADLSFLGVAAGDATSTNAVLWTRAVDAAAPAPATLTAQVAKDSGFTADVLSFTTATDAAKDYTAKVAATGLSPGTLYYYRFVGEGSPAPQSIAGMFKTAPAPEVPARVRFGFSGDLDGLMRPYAAAHDFAAQNFDFFVFLGDTIYENASSGSPGVTLSGTIPGPTATGATQAQLFADYSRKYREQFLPVNAGGQNGLQSFFAAQGNYTLYDNHELGNRQYINGGAPAGGPVGDFAVGAGVDARVSSNDTNVAGPFINKAPGFQTLQQVYMNYQPVAERGLVNTGGADPRTEGTPQLFNAQQWGKNALFVNLDTRSYRDIRMKTAANADDTGARADNPDRTMLGATQLNWFKQSLLGAEAAGVKWKFIAVSDPIDQLGPIGGALAGVTNAGNTAYAPVASDGGKSWMGGYRAERNDILKFIADHHIYNVVFLTTDDHQNRVNELLYSTNSQTGVQGTYARVPRCFQIVAGPLGATGPDLITNHAFANHKQIADSLAAAQVAAGVDPIGLDPNYPGLHDVVRENDPMADRVRQPLDFYSPDTFNFVTLDVSADGNTLTVKTFGINSTAQNSFKEYDPATNPLRQILSFQVDAQNDLAGINHFIVVYQENWSFDSLYPYFPGADGIANSSDVSLNQIDRLSGQPISSLAVYDPVSRKYPTQNPPVPLSPSNVQDPRFLSNPFDTNSPALAGFNSLVPYNLSRWVANYDLTGDIVHRYWQEQFQINHGAMNQFVTWSDNPGLVMSYFDASDLPEGQLAQQYVMCDKFFHSAFGGSFLNHQFLVAAQAPVYPNAETVFTNGVATLDDKGLLALNATGNLVHDGNITPIGGVSFQNPAVKFDKNYAVNTIFSVNLAASGGTPSTNITLLPSLNNSNPADPNRPYVQTIGDRMDAGGVSWKWYSGGFDDAVKSSPSNPEHYGVAGTSVSPLFQWHHQAFAFYDNYAPWTNGVRNARSAAHLQDETQFFNDVANNTLPQVSFIKPLGPDNEHPGYANLLQGQLHVLNIVKAVQANPALWARTAIVITYDEHGGRWDHVTPPARDIWGPGSRVPAIIVSPLAKKAFVDHTVYDTSTILSTIEKRFGLEPLNALDAAAPTFLPAFDAEAVSRPSIVPTLSASLSGTTVTISWLPSATGWALQKKTSVNGVWTNVTGVVNNTLKTTVSAGQPVAFYRLIQP